MLLSRVHLKAIWLECTPSRRVTGCSGFYNVSLFHVVATHVCRRRKFKGTHVMLYPWYSTLDRPPIQYFYSYNIVSRTVVLKTAALFLHPDLFKNRTGCRKRARERPQTGQEWFVECIQHIGTDHLGDDGESRRQYCRRIVH